MNKRLNVRILISILSIIFGLSSAGWPSTSYVTAATGNGANKERANSYDNEWKAAWVIHGRSVLATSGKTAGFVLEIGDSITHSAAYGWFPLQGQGKTAEDSQLIDWAHGTSWGSDNFSVSNKSGWYLAQADTTSNRGMTSSSGISLEEILSGCCNGGTNMPASTNPATARQIIASPTYSANLQIDTLIAAFSDAQFAVVMLGTNDPSNSKNISDLAAIVDKLEAQHILPILSTIPPRNDAISNQVPGDPAATAGHDLDQYADLQRRGPPHGQRQRLFQRQQSLPARRRSCHPHDRRCLAERGLSAAQLAHRAKAQRGEAVRDRWGQPSLIPPALISQEPARKIKGGDGNDEKHSWICDIISGGIPD
jgi:hypothetical protein